VISEAEAKEGALLSGYPNVKYKLIVGDSEVRKIVKKINS
jgi:hypothetical protein